MVLVIDAQSTLSLLLWTTTDDTLSDARKGVMLLASQDEDSGSKSD